MHAYSATEAHASCPGLPQLSNNCWCLGITKQFAQLYQSSLEHVNAMTAASIKLTGRTPRTAAAPSLLTTPLLKRSNMCDNPKLENPPLGSLVVASPKALDTSQHNCRFPSSYTRPRQVRTYDPPINSHTAFGTRNGPSPFVKLFIHFRFVMSKSATYGGVLHSPQTPPRKTICFSPTSWQDEP